MRTTPRKISRRRQTGEVSIEQTQDPLLIGAMLQRAEASLGTRVAENGDCFLIAYVGEKPVGIAGLQTEVDAALMDPIFVVEEVRQRAIGLRLVHSVRRAAHVRGAQNLYTLVPPALADYFVRLGFTEATRAELHQSFGQASKLHLDGFDLEKCCALRLDLSQEGIIVR